MGVGVGQEIGSYTIEALLGQGGQAEVWRVRHRTLDSLAALKVLRVTSTALEKRLVQEGRVQASMRHPSIVSVLDVVEIEGALGLLLEFVDGPSLEQVLTERGVSLTEATTWFGAILSAVEAAHLRGIVHRDLKPANVLLAPVGGSLLPKVADFGLARILDEAGSGTRNNSAMGTLEYMAPEQVSDARSVDARADIFALGCMFYELVTGRRPFAAPNLLGYYRAIERGEYTPPCALVPGLPARFDGVVAGCLAFEREDRWATVGALREALDPTPPVGHGQALDGLVTAVPAARTPVPSTPGAMTYNPESLLDVDGPVPAAAPPDLAPDRSRVPDHRGPQSGGDLSLLEASPVRQPDPHPASGRTAAGVVAALVVGCVVLAVAFNMATGVAEAPPSVLVDGVPDVSTPPAAASTIATPGTSTSVTPLASTPPVDGAPAPGVAIPGPESSRGPASPASAPRPATVRPVAEPTTPTESGGRTAPPEAPPLPSPAPVPAVAASGASFSTDGNFAVQFSSGNASYTPGQSFPAGDYDITADFGEGRKVAGHVTVVESARLVVRCQPGGGRCVAR